MFRYCYPVSISYQIHYVHVYNDYLQLFLLIGHSAVMWSTEVDFCKHLVLYDSVDCSAGNNGVVSELLIFNL